MIPISSLRSFVTRSVALLPGQQLYHQASSSFPRPAAAASLGQQLRQASSFVRPAASSGQQLHRGQQLRLGPYERLSGHQYFTYYM
ncbi:hypothetical protein TgHK011_001813 [Trichoderma gracile]|nr:hypothetical protein TgHK011_001813 [Trichoderma gracile]